MKKTIPIIAVAWILSLITTLAVVYYSPLVPIGTNKIGDSAITSEKIADNAIVTVKLADGSVTSAKILDGALTAADIANGSIISVKIADSAVTTNKIADNAVTATKIADSAIVTIKLADGSVTSAKILDGTITASDLATGSVTAMKIADGAVTTDKIADGAVTSIKLAPMAIPFNSTYSVATSTTTSTSWIDISAMSVEINLTRASQVIIIFSAEAWMSSTGDYLCVQALVDSSLTHPSATGNIVVLTRATIDNVSSYSYTFYSNNVSAGVHTVKMQWRSYYGATASVESRTLTVFALPS
jgi:hypothetical protein